MKIALISDIHFGKDSRTKEFSVPGEEVFDETTGAVSLEQGLIDVLKDSNKWSNSNDGVNDDLSIANRFSIIADPNSANNFHSMKYIEYMGAKWKITNVEVQYPRLVLTIGGEFNG